jgi:single-stranded-DNA-specific exonuclease
MSCTINQCNETRKYLDRNITNEALRLIATDQTLKNRKTTVLFQPEWHKGVIGIVASRLTETYYRPTVILTKSKDLITGSARSVDGYNLYQAIEACQDLLENFGGHTYAAGLTLKPENIEAFAERFEQVVSQTILPAQMIPRIEVDAEISLKDITPEFFYHLKRFRPYGPGNLKPVFVTRNVYDFGTSKVVGREKEHLKLELIESTSPKIIKGIAFGKGHLLQKIKTSQPFDICYTIEECVYDTHLPLQLMVTDIKFRT